MDIGLILAVGLLAAMVANIVDWTVTRRGPIWWFPAGRVWVACLAAIGAASVGALVGWIPPSATWLLSAPLFIFEQLASIWIRHASPAAVA